MVLAMDATYLTAPAVIVGAIAIALFLWRRRT